ncbi:MAG: (Fe-S)-binding protein [Desulfobacterota bacterium]|nr:(Fe-S)-binding protein [Thermodesulfobacteriota bacterium]MDW8002543.1 (Fe-S)-binding protein [Deltaproteobacteria bacterium]
MRISDFSKKKERLLKIKKEDLIDLPYPYNRRDLEPDIQGLTEDQLKTFDSSLDGISALGIRMPKDRKEEEEIVRKFINGLQKLLTPENNWTFLMPLYHSLEYCVRCQLCNDHCPVYIASGKKEIYRPTLRGEILRRLVERYVKKRSSVVLKLSGCDLELNWQTIARLGELAYRCTLCRRCAMACPLGVDNGLISREIRKLLSQELGLAPKELHELGTVQQLKVGSSTGITPKALKNIIEFIESDIEEKLGKKIKIPVDKEGAEVLLIHNAGEYLSWPENVEAFAIIFDLANIDWTLSSDLMGYDAVNYGLWYDDIQFARIAIRHIEVAKKLKVKKINVGECGHAHKALVVVADRVLTGDMNIPRESALPLLRDLIVKGKLKVDPKKNNFPVTLHDPCNVVRLMGIVEPQREILRRICPDFREMEPHGIHNYCCGGGSGFAIIQSMNFPSWRSSVSGRMKLKQILEVFQDVISPDVKKYVCAPCSNCKGQLRDLFNSFKTNELCGIFYGGIAELIVNALEDLKKPFIEWEWH